MSTESSLDNLIISDKPNFRNSRHFVWHIIFPIIGGFMFGYDTGVISGALILLRNYFQLNTFSQEIVVSVTVLAAAVGSLVAGILSNKFGRKKTIILSCICFVIGSLLMSISQSLTMLIIGRAIVGIGIGMSATCCPVYIAEMTSKEIRGRIIVLYQSSITAGMFFAAIVDASLFYVGNEGWRYMLGFAVIPSLIELIGMFTVPESYRWLLSQNRIEEARNIIDNQNQIPKDRIDEYITEIIEANKLIEMEIREHGANNKCMVFQIFHDKVARQSLLIGCGLQMLAQIVGINTIMYYTSLVIQMSGIEDISTILWFSVLVTFFNFLPSFIGFILIDKIGRRKLAIVSLIGVLFSLMMIAITFQVLSFQSDRVSQIDPLLISKEDFYCSGKTNCDQCVSSSVCGFCYIPSKDNKNLIMNSTCLASPFHFSKFSARGWCAKNSTVSNNKVVWLFDICKSNYSWIIIVGMIFYLINFSTGMGPIPWAITSEIYPLWCRSTNMSLSTATNWTFNFIISATFLSLTEAITKYGTFWLYSSFAFCGLFFIYKFMPETNQKTLEEINNS